MKLKSIIQTLAALAITVGAASAITVNVGRGTGNPGIVAVDNGTAITDGGYYFALGTFSALDVATSTYVDAPPTITSYETLLTAVDTFKVFRATTTNATVGAATRGLLTGSFAGTSPTEGTAAEFNLLEMYFVVGNKATAALSDAFSIFKLSAGTPDFPSNMSASTVVSVTLSDVASITPLANAGSVLDDPNTGAGRLNLVVNPIPEPSAVLLSALGALGLLRRRRN